MTAIRHLYLHTPFCAKICPYCAFHVHRGGPSEQREFVEALILEVAQLKNEYDFSLESIYFGGGTPSLLSRELFAQIMEVLPPCTGEITMEINPKTVTREKSEGWKSGGLNRISLGAQSFDANYLKILGRDHTPVGIVRSVSILREAGFTNIGLDLMFALPNQPRVIWESTLVSALACGPTHLSCYGLTYEEDTPFFKSLSSGTWQKNEVDEIWMFAHTEKVLTEAGLPPYEISNFCRPGFESVHNQAYWLGKDYLGCGPSAYSTVGNKRWQNKPDTQAYIHGIKEGGVILGEKEDLSDEIRRKERLMFGLRTREGVFASELDAFSEVRDRLMNEGFLIEESPSRLKLSAQGRLVADSIAELFA